MAPPSYKNPFSPPPNVDTPLVSPRTYLILIIILIPQSRSLRRLILERLAVESPRPPAVAKAAMEKRWCDDRPKSKPIRFAASRESPADGLTQFVFTPSSGL